MKESVKIDKLFKKLLEAKVFNFPESGRAQDLQVPTTHGVYVIYDPKGEVVHVGRTYRNSRGLHQRLYNHMQGQSSFVQQYLNGMGSTLGRSFQYRYIEISNPRERALLEFLAIGRLCPKHLGLGLSRVKK